MRYELEKFFSNPCEASGLLIAEAPTGYGKTYETIQAIYRCWRREIATIFCREYLTNFCRR